MSRDLEKQVLEAQAEHDADVDAAFEEPAAAELERVSDPEPGADAVAAVQAAEAVAWLDEALKELRGALHACGVSIEAGALAPEVVSAKMNALVMEMMGGAAG